MTTTRILGALLLAAAGLTFTAPAHAASRVTVANAQGAP